MTQLLSNIVAGLIVGCLFLTPGIAAESETPTISAQMDELFSDWDSSAAPGGVAAVIRDGRIVYEKAFGMADLERGVALTPHSVFEIGSVSKQFTAMSILLLEHDGKLSLDDDVRIHIPELPEYEHPITIRQLLHHTSGIRDIETLVPLAGWRYTNYYSPARLLDLITRQKELNFSPGSEFLYSNSGYLLLAYIVERVSGETLREFADARIFQPLGMRHTVFWDTPGQIVKDRAIPYSTRPDGGHQMEMWYLPFAGPSGVYTTVQDLALWDANFYDNKLGGGSALIEKMVTPGILEDGKATEYAAGLAVSDYDGQTVFEHGGAWMGFRAQMSRFPGRRLTVILLSNASEVRAPVSSIAQIFSGAEDETQETESPAFEAPPTVELPPDLLSAYEGIYWRESELLLRTIEMRDGVLHYVRSEESTTELAAIEAGRFVMVGVGIRVDVDFATEGGTEARAMTVTIEGREPLVFERLELRPAESQAGHQGKYWSDELERELRLRIEHGTLNLAWADDALQTPMVQVGPDDFLARRFVAIPWNPQDVRILIERDDGDRVTGLRLSCEMVRGVSFVKMAEQ
jgi:CubicO group peptidase (beta-lactamase class C family)